MWASLSNPGHAEGFADYGANLAPLRQLVEQLAGRPYKDEVYAYTSLAVFVLITSPTYAESTGHDGIAIEYDARRGSFAVR